MALSHVWSNARRRIDEGLAVTFKKSLKYATNINNITRPYWRYERRRTMSFTYLGLTASAAQACAAAWNRALYRKAWTQKWIANESPPGDNSGAIGFWDDYGRVGDPLDDSQFTFVSGGEALVKHAAGSAFEVEVRIDETLPYNHQPFDFSAGGRGDWVEFENDPTMATSAFRWGSPGFFTSGPFVDFTLDAIEYQLALLSVEVFALGSEPMLKVEAFSPHGEVGLDNLRLQTRANALEPWTTSIEPYQLEPILFSQMPLPPFQARLVRCLDWNGGQENHRAVSNVLEVK